MKEYVLITGASSGICRELTILFANSGHDVVAVGQNEIELQRLKLLCKFGNVLTITADLSQQTEIDRITKLAIFQGDVSIKYLVHGAVLAGPYVSLTKVARLDLEKTISVNIFAPIFLTQALAPRLTHKSRVLIFGSDYVGINRIRPHLTGPYAISKSGLRPATEHLRMEYGNDLLVGHLNPGPTETRMFNQVKTSVLNSVGTFNVKPVPPKQVAEFVKTVLEKTSDLDYRKIDFDYRNPDHKKILTDKTASLSVLAKL